MLSFFVSAALVFIIFNRTSDYVNCCSFQLVYFMAVYIESGERFFVVKYRRNGSDINPGADHLGSSEMPGGMKTMKPDLVCFTPSVHYIWRSFRGNSRQRKNTVFGFPGISQCQTFFELNFPIQFAVVSFSEKASRSWN